MTSWWRRKTEPWAKKSKNHKYERIAMHFDSGTMNVGCWYELLESERTKTCWLIYIYSEKDRDNDNRISYSTNYLLPSLYIEYPNCQSWNILRFPRKEWYRNCCYHHHDNNNNDHHHSHMYRYRPSYERRIIIIIIILFVVFDHRHTSSTPHTTDSIVQRYPPPTTTTPQRHPHRHWYRTRSYRNMSLVHIKNIVSFIPIDRWI